MCFSASASFGAGVILTTIGVASLKKVQKPSQNFFASIPLIFGAQQITEGFLWLALSDPDYEILKWPATYIFLFFAQVVWPFWVPFSVWKLNIESRFVKLEMLLMAIGAIVSVYLAFCLVNFDVEARIVGKHISYLQKYPPALSKYGGLLYILATIAPPFFSAIRRMWLLGASILVSYIITAVFYEDYIVSVWCFFAAIISAVVFVIMVEVRRKNMPEIEAVSGLTSRADSKTQ